ncbi:mitochondrial ribosomal protein subunit S18 [Hygrophoropsis aurantiaca]|uniref:Mitochondrial ribosomal protein subunit S18 n=1 Tax=Hygrophoropsis aurantiaca TaxID=72124 RepID=A0ACB8AV03_9AGAM|nr:mitochondrial ribosomal protein subunit S18 [Hygrophoropsis aurantiaca]
MFCLKTSFLPIARAIPCHTTPMGAAFRRAYSVEGMNLLDEMGVGQPRKTTPDDLPPRGPDYSIPNPLRGFRELRKRKEERPPPYALHVHSSRNNTKVFLAKPTGHMLAWWTGGSVGFKKGNRAGYEAGYQCAVRSFARIEEEQAKTGPLTLAVKFRGFGQGREAMTRAFMTSEGDKVRNWVVEIEDRSPIKIGGTRSQKTRRL